jgi:hypothetical protein
MKKAAIVLVCACMAFAGRTSLWSGSFLLRETLGAKPSKNAASIENAVFDFSVHRQSLSGMVRFNFSGTGGADPVMLRIYRVDGRLVDDLSDRIASPSSAITWNGSAFPAGVYVAAFRDAHHAKIIRFILQGN